MTPARVLQPRHFDSFRCIGADCEDTCCVGWLVQVDKQSYEKYQDCTDSQLGPSLSTLVTINADSSTDADYAKITLNGITCPFLSEGLCSVQQRLGEEYLPNMCATFPRVMNRVDDVLQRSLDLSCPEAARIVLLDPRPMEFEEREYKEGADRPGALAALDMSRLQGAAEPYRLFRDLRREVIRVLQDRSRPIWDRLFIVGCVCEKLDRMGADGWDGSMVNVSQDTFAECKKNPTARLEIVLELVVARIRSDFNPASFLACYREFMNGIQWTSKSTMDEIGARYVEAYSENYVPVMREHKHILEQYLVNYAYRTQFPLGMPESNRRLHNDRVPSCITSQYMLMAAHYAIVETLLIGMAGFHKAAFGPVQIVKLIQSCTKTFEHSIAFPGQAIQVLAEKGMTNPANLCVLIRPAG